MTLLFDPIARRLTDEHNIPVSVITIKRSDVMPIKISVPGASATAKLGMYAKLVGDYSSIPLVAVEAIGNPVELTPQSNTLGINTALGIGTDRELQRLEMMCEIVYSEGSKQIATVTLLLVLHNNIARPGLPGDQLQDDPYSASVPIATAVMVGVSKPDGTSITINGNGVLTTPSIRSIGGYNNCAVDLGDRLNLTSQGAGRVTLDVFNPPVWASRTMHGNKISVTLERFPGSGWYRVMVHCLNRVTQMVSAASNFSMPLDKILTHGSISFARAQSSSDTHPSSVRILPLDNNLAVSSDEDFFATAGTFSHIDAMIYVSQPNVLIGFDIIGSFASDSSLNCFKVC